jgi:phage shock protein C
MAEPKKLIRPKDSRMLAGVCQGVADYFGIDATVVRLATVILALVTFGGAVLVYLAAWLLMPEE